MVRAKELDPHQPERKPAVIYSQALCKSQSRPFNFLDATLAIAESRLLTEREGSFNLLSNPLQRDRGMLMVAMAARSQLMAFRQATYGNLLQAYNIAIHQCIAM